MQTCCYLLSLPKLPRPPKQSKGSNATTPTQPYGESSGGSSSNSSIESTPGHIAKDGQEKAAETAPDRSLQATDRADSEMSGLVARDALGLRTDQLTNKGRLRAQALVAGLHRLAGSDPTDRDDGKAKDGSTDYTDDMSRPGDPHANIDEAPTALEGAKSGTDDDDSEQNSGGQLPDTAAMEVAGMADKLS